MELSELNPLINVPTINLLISRLMDDCVDIPENNLVNFSIIIIFSYSRRLFAIFISLWECGTSLIILLCKVKIQKKIKKKKFDLVR